MSIFRRFILFASAITVIALTGACSNDIDSPDRQPLTDDELYLVNTYVSITYAKNLYQKDPERADSIFAVLDSTTDSLRISNTIKAINADPERWTVIFSEIEKTLKESSHRGRLEGTR